jgi:hypothetical protein
VPEYWVGVVVVMCNEAVDERMEDTMKLMNDRRKSRSDDRQRLLRAPRGLVVLNLALLGVLGAVSFSPMADAQSAKSANGATRARGEYSIVGGATIGGVSSVIYVLDTINRELIALNWNDSTKSLEGVGYRDLSVDAKSDPDR